MMNVKDLVKDIKRDFLKSIARKIKMEEILGDQEIKMKRVKETLNKGKR